MHKVGIIGSVNSTAITIEKLHEHAFNIKGILGYEPENTKSISGWRDLRALSRKLDIPFRGFEKINNEDHIAWMRNKKIDILFAVGFSQLLGEEWLKMPSLGCIGFHPTRLPKGRGRAPLAWIILEERKGAACFFLMGEGADDGPVFIQQPFEVKDSDDATSVQTLILDATRKALDTWLPELKAGVWNPQPQDDHLASWYGKRTPLDGLIDWDNSAVDIDRLIKASTKPHPGSYTFHKRKKLRIWKSSLESHINIRGVVGRVLLKDHEKGCLVQCGQGLLWINQYNFDDDSDIEVLKVGHKLGFSVQEEIFKLWEQINKITK